MNDTTQKIFPLAQEAIEIAEASQENPQSIFEALRAGKLTKDEFLEGLANWQLYTEAKYRALEAEYKPLIEEMEADLKFLKDKQEFIKRTITGLLEPGPETEFVTDSVRMFYKETEAVEIDHPELVPLEYCEVQEPKPSKKLIAAAIEAGETVEGARIKTNYHLQVKPGGVRAVSNAKQRQKRIAKEQGQLIEGGDNESV